MWDQWNDVFRQTLGHAERSLVSELRDVRNKWAHQEPFSSDDAYRALDSAARLLTAVSAPQADEIEKMKMELLRLRFDEQVRSEKRKSAGTAIESAGHRQPQALARGGDAAQGRGQRPLPAGRVRRRPLAGAPGRRHGRVPRPGRVLPPHLPHREPEGDCWSARCGGSPARAATRWCSSRPTSAAARRTRCWRSITCSPASPPSELAGIDAVHAGGRGRRRCRPSGAWCWWATRSRPATRSTKPDGTVVRTLWGELAWQLGGKKAFARIQADDEKATSPGDALRELFNEYGPCLILIDEWVAYARQLHDQSDLPAGSFETQFTFAQVLTESAKLAQELPAGDQPAGLGHRRLAAHPGRRRGGGRPARARGARPAAQRGRPGRVLLAAGQRRGRLRDRAPAAVRAVGRSGAVQGPRRGGAGLRRPLPHAAARSSRPSAATPTTRSASRRPTRSTRRSSTGSTPTGPRW